MLIAGVRCAGTVTLAVGDVTGLPPNTVLTLATLMTDPASSAACVTFQTFVQVVDCPGASSVAEQLWFDPIWLSVTVIGAVVVTLPVFVTV